jgi:gluconate 5-dehydrogenase
MLIVPCARVVGSDSDADWHRLLDASLTSAFLVGRAVGTLMLTRHAGNIINVCSLESELAKPTIAIYAARRARSRC